MSQNDDNTYRGILRNMSVFGGVQIFQIVAGLLRGKIAAIFLGPAGMGVASLFTSSATTLQQLSSLGLGQSIVREIAETRKGHTTEDITPEDSTVVTETPEETVKEFEGIEDAVRVTRFLLAVTGVCGALLTIVLSGWLSKVTFGSYSYTSGFILLSLMVCFTTLSNGEIAILQGLHRVKRLAVATLGALAIGLAAMLPFYWILGERGIVPAMAVNAAATWMFYRRCTSKETSPSRFSPFLFSFHTEKIRPYRRVIARMVKLGVVLVAAQLLGSLTTYLINIYVRQGGSTLDVGLYQSANSITMQCVAVVFAAMGMEFFPRLTSVAQSKEKICLLVNRQIEVVALIAAPIAALMILFSPLVVRIILSEEFLSAVPLIRWMCIGILFKAIAYPSGYISFARGDRKTFFWLEGVVGNAILLILSMVGFKLWGIIGLGVASTATFFVYIFVYIVLTHRLYSFSFTRQAAMIAVTSSLLLGLTFLSSMVFLGTAGYLAMGIFTSLTLLYSLWRLRKLLKKD